MIFSLGLLFSLKLLVKLLSLRVKYRMNNSSQWHIKLVLLFILIFAFLILLLSSGKASQFLPNNNLAQTFNPPADIAQLVNQATMTDYAKQIFYSAGPVIDTDRKVFEQHCLAPLSSTTVELGCYTSDNRIYLLNISNPQLQKEMVVTAAHEMLHAAYAKLSPADQSTIDSEVEAEFPQVRNKNLALELRQYKITEPGQRNNELHSIIGSEYSPISSSLENYYSKYFTNRSQVVAYANQFKQVFSQLQSTLYALASQLKQLRLEMMADLRRRNIQGYNSLVPQYNALVKQYNDTVAEYNSLSRSLIGEESPAQSQ